MAFVLPCPKSLLPGESLASLATRNACALGFPDPVRLFDSLGLRRRPFETFIHQVPRGEAEQAVADLFGITAQALRRAANGLFGDRSAYVAGKVINTAYVMKRERRFCSMCLAEGEPYHRAAWDLALLTACPRHGIFLQDRCPVCLRRVVWQGEPLHCCSNRACAGDLRTTQTISVPARNMPGVHELQDRLMCSDDTLLPVPGVDFNGWLTLVWGLGAIECGATGMLWTSRKVDKYSVQTCIDAGIRITAGWPSTFHTVLDRWRVAPKLISDRKQKLTQFGAFRAWLKNVDVQSLAPVMTEVVAEYARQCPQLAYKGTAVSDYIAKSSGTVRNVKFNEVKNILNVSSRRCEELARDYDLYGTIFTGQKSANVYRADAVKALALRASRQIGTTQARTALGISAYIFWAFQRANLIPQIQEKDRIRGPRTACYETDAIEAFLRKIEGMVKPATPRRLVGIMDFPRYNMSVVGGCIAVLNGQISPCTIYEQEQGLRRLRFDESEISAAFAVPENASSLTKASVELGVAAPAVTGWAGKGLLRTITRRSSSGKKSRFVLREEIKRFRGEYVYGEEIRSLLSTKGGRKAPSFLMKMGVVPVSGPEIDGLSSYVYLRSDIDKVDRQAVLELRDIARAQDG